MSVLVSFDLDRIRILQRPRQLHHKAKLTHQNQESEEPKKDPGEGGVVPNPAAA